MGLIFLVVVVILGLLLLLVVLLAELQPPSRHPYRQREQLFTPAEWRFLRVLRQAVPEGLDVFGKVRVADVLQPESGLDRGEWQKAFNRIAGKHIDFILCDVETGRMVCGIELNDRSHQRPDRRERDDFLTGACQNARFPLLMYAAASDYDVTSLRTAILACIADTPAPEIPRPLESVDPESGSMCPRCAAPLARKIARRGRHSGDPFIACTAYPRCRYTRPV